VIRLLSAVRVTRRERPMVRIRGVLLGPEVERDTKDGNRSRSHLPTTPGPDSNIEGPWPTRDEHPEDDA
jgi:hypothetical protein